MKTQTKAARLADQVTAGEILANSLGGSLYALRRVVEDAADMDAEPPRAHRDTIIAALHSALDGADAHVKTFKDEMAKS